MNTLHAPPEDRLDALVDRGILTPEQLIAVREAIGHLPEPLPCAMPMEEPASVEAAPPSRRVLFAELAGYIGGALALAAGAFALGTAWDELGHWGRTAVFVAITVIALGAAVALRRGVDQLTEARQRVVATLSTIAAGGAGAAVGVAMAGTWSNEACTLAGGLAGAAVAFAGYSWTPSPIGHIGGYAGLVVALGGLLTMVDASSAVVGIAVGGLGLVWVAIVAMGLLPDLDVGLALGAGTLFVGTQMLMAHHIAAGLLVLGLAGLGAFALYLVRQSTVLLVAGVLFLTVTVGRALGYYTHGSLAAPLALLAGAAVLLAASWFGLRLRATERRELEQRRPESRQDGDHGPHADGDGAGEEHPHQLRRFPTWPQFPQQRNRR